MSVATKAKEAAKTAAKEAKTAAKKAPVLAVKAEKKGKTFTPSVKVLATLDIPVNKLVIDESFTGRSAPVPEEKVLELADTLRVRQVQPIQVRAIPGTDTYRVVFGVTRTRAGQKILVGYPKDEKGGTTTPIPDFTLRAEVVEVSDEEAIFCNLVENAARNATTAIDDAKNHQMLRDMRTEEYPDGMKDAAITRLYGYGHQASVTQLKKLLTLPEEIQQQIHESRMTKQAGYFIADWCKRRGFGEDTDAGFRCDAGVIDTMLTPGDKDIAADTDNGLSTNYVVQAIKTYEKNAREAANPAGEGAAGEGAADNPPSEGAAGEGAAGDPPSTYALTLKDFKTTLEEFAGLPDVSAKMAEYCQVTLTFLKGEMEKDAFYDWVAVNMA